MSTDQRSLDIDAIIDRQPVGVFQVLACVLLLGVLVIDGIDIQLLSLVAPAIIGEWGVSRGDFGPALAGALIGMSLGAVFGGLAGDRFGRLPVLVASTLLFGGATVLAGMTDSVSGMTMLRIVSGLGFGAAAPNAIAMGTDWLPTRYRSLMTSIMSIGTPAGGMIGAALVIVVLPDWGWRGTFYASGLFTIAIAVLLVAVVRESPQWLVARGRLARARSLLAGRLGADLNDDAHYSVSAEPLKGRKSAFLTRDYLRLNLGAGMGFFAIALVSYALVAWTVIMLTTLGYPMEAAIGAIFAFNIAAVAAAVLAGLVMNFLGTRLTLAISSALLCASVLALMQVLSGAGHEHAVDGRVPVLVGAAGGFAGSAMAAIYAMMAYGYQAGCRSGGLGFGMMMGRAGGIVASFFGGYLLEVEGTEVWPFLSVLAVASLLGVLCAFVADRHVPMMVREKRPVDPW
jgi:AAHS family 4-hydroxybenzoate transporter-like MFS transporter